MAARKKNRPTWADVAEAEAIANTHRAKCEGMSELLAKTERERAEALAKLDAIESDLGRARLAAENFEGRAISAERRIGQLEERADAMLKSASEERSRRFEDESRELDRLYSAAERALFAALSVRPMKLGEARDAANSLIAVSVPSRTTGETIYRAVPSRVSIALDDLRRLLEAAEGA